jgi:hypothetical protein
MLSSSSVPAEAAVHLAFTLPEFAKVPAGEPSFLLQVEVLSGAIDGVYLAPEATLPSTKRRVLQQQRFSVCQNPHCDRNAPQAWNRYARLMLCYSCVSMFIALLSVKTRPFHVLTHRFTYSAGGICLSCMEPSSDWQSAAPARDMSCQSNESTSFARTRAHGQMAAASSGYTASDALSSAKKDSVTQAGAWFTIRGLFTPDAASVSADKAATGAAATAAALAALPRSLSCSTVECPTPGAPADEGAAQQCVTVRGHAFVETGVKPGAWANLGRPARVRVRVVTARLPRPSARKAGNGGRVEGHADEAADTPESITSVHDEVVKSWAHINAAAAAASAASGRSAAAAVEEPDDGADTDTATKKSAAGDDAV